jgi:hypothetical protein
MTRARRTEEGRHFEVPFHFVHEKILLEVHEVCLELLEPVEPGDGVSGEGR